MDDPVSTYLPGFDDIQVITQINPIDGTCESRPSKRPITIRHLMTHTSGIGYGFSDPVLFRLLQDSQKTELDVPLMHDPGDKWTYNVTILSRESVAAMGENQIGALVVEEQPAANSAVTRPFPLGAGRDKFGLGFQITEPDDRYTGFAVRAA